MIDTTRGVAVLKKTGDVWTYPEATTWSETASGSLIVFQEVEKPLDPRRPQWAGDESPKPEVQQVEVGRHGPGTWDQVTYRKSDA